MSLSRLFTASTRILNLSSCNHQQQITGTGRLRCPSSGVRLFQRQSNGNKTNNHNPFDQLSRRRANNAIRLEPVEGPPTMGRARPSDLWKPVVFTTTFTLGTFVAVSIWEYENLASLRINRRSVEWFRQRVQAQQRQLDNRYRSLQSWWSSLSPGERVFVPICALNVLVFAAWRVPALKGFMLKYFCSNPAAQAICWPMVLSTFSHYSGFHIFANMYVLHSFANVATKSLGTEQFLGLYLTAGVLSSLASYAFKASAGAAGMSLGASGAIMGILAYVCSKYPDTELGIMFLPMVTFSAGAAIKVMMGVDLAGCILGWRFFDHAAHLGGAVVGIFWCYFGAEHIWPKRIYVQQYWHQLRANK